MSNLSILPDSGSSRGEEAVEVAEKHWFSFQGQIDRTRFLFRSLLCSAVYFGVLARLHYSSGAFYLFLLLLLAGTTWLQLATTLKRSQDRGRNGVGACVTMNILFLLCLLVLSANGRDWPFSTQYGTDPFESGRLVFSNPVLWALHTSGVMRLLKLGALGAIILLGLSFAPLVWNLLPRGDAGDSKNAADPRASMPVLRNWFELRGRISNSAFATRVFITAIACLVILLLSEAVDHYWGRGIAIPFASPFETGIAEPSIGGLSGFADLFLYLMLLADL